MIERPLNIEGGLDLARSDETELDRNLTEWFHYASSLPRETLSTGGEREARGTGGSRGGVGLGRLSRGFFA